MKIPEDFEDQLNRVRMMAQLAWDAVRELPASGSDDEKAAFLTRGAKEEAEKLWNMAYGRTA